MHLKVISSRPLCKEEIGKHPNRPASPGARKGDTPCLIYTSLDITESDKLGGYTTNDMRV